MPPINLRVREAAVQKVMDPHIHHCLTSPRLPPLPPRPRPRGRRPGPACRRRPALRATQQLVDGEAGDLLRCSVVLATVCEIAAKRKGETSSDEVERGRVELVRTEDAPQRRALPAF